MPRPTENGPWLPDLPPCPTCSKIGTVKGRVNDLLFVSCGSVGCHRFYFIECIEPVPEKAVTRYHQPRIPGGYKKKHKGVSR